MTSPLLGEFMGTLVLILLGNGCVANVLLKHSKAHGFGVDGHHQRLGICRDVGRLCRYRMWE
jgi:glycerol uptake facilitator-like aquaporin